MKVSGIYKIQSKIKPDRFYIGSSNNINKRWIEHIKKLRNNKHHSIIFQNHFNKYGEADLQFSILLGCEIKDLITTEQYFLDSYKPYFNVCRYAGNTLGRYHTDETKKKISEKKKGTRAYIMTDETKIKLSNIFKDKPLSEETKRRMKEGWEARRIRLNKPKSKYLIEKYGT